MAIGNTTDNTDSSVNLSWGSGNTTAWVTTSNYVEDSIGKVIGNIREKKTHSKKKNEMIFTGVRIILDYLSILGEEYLYKSKYIFGLDGVVRKYKTPKHLNKRKQGYSLYSKDVVEEFTIQDLNGIILEIKTLLRNKERILKEEQEIINSFEKDGRLLNSDKGLYNGSDIPKYCPQCGDTLKPEEERFKKQVNNLVSDSLFKVIEDKTETINILRTTIEKRDGEIKKLYEEKNTIIRDSTKYYIEINKLEQEIKNLEAQLKEDPRFKTNPQFKPNYWKSMKDNQVDIDKDTFKTTGGVRGTGGDGGNLSGHLYSIGGPCSTNAVISDSGSNIKYHHPKYRCEAQYNTTT